MLADPFAAPRAGFEIQGLQAELGTLTKRRPGGPQEELDGRELEAHVLRRFSGQVASLPSKEATMQLLMWRQDSVRAAHCIMDFSSCAWRRP